MTTLITAVKETNFAGGELKMEKLRKENSTDVLVSIREKSYICPRKYKNWRWATKNVVLLSNEENLAIRKHI